MWFVIAAAVGLAGVVASKFVWTRGETASRPWTPVDCEVEEWEIEEEVEVEAISEVLPSAPLPVSVRSRESCICGCWQTVEGGKYRFVIASHISRLTVDKVLHAMLFCSAQELFDARMEHGHRLRENQRSGQCICGCGLCVLRKKAKYVQGHDARYKMDMLRLLERYG